MNSTRMHVNAMCALCRLQVERIDSSLRFMAGCHKRRLNQAVSALSFSLDFYIAH